MFSQKPTYTIYTDGACKGNPGKGGWGVYIINSKGESSEYYGNAWKTTNNKMELTAAIEGLKISTHNIDEQIICVVYTDSIYVKNGITKWIENWKKNDWKTAQKKPVKNKELWQQLDAQVNNKNLYVVWKWVKGHSNDIGNDQADRLANKGIDTLF